MRIGLTWKDYTWTAVVLIIFFVILPIGLWQLSIFREGQIERNAKRVAQQALADASREIHQAASELETEQMRGASSEKSYRSPKLEVAVKTACDALRSSVEKQTQDFEVPNFNCFFYGEREGTEKYVRATDDLIYFPDNSIIEKLKEPSVSEELHMSKQWSSSWTVVVPIYMEESDARDYTESKKFISFILSSVDD